MASPSSHYVSEGHTCPLRRGPNRLPLWWHLYYSITISLIYKVYFTLLVVLEAVPLLYTSGISLAAVQRPRNVRAMSAQRPRNVRATSAQCPRNVRPKRIMDKCLYLWYTIPKVGSDTWRNSARISPCIKRH